MADGYDRCILGFNTTTNRTQLISCKPDKFKVGPNVVIYKSLRDT
jgi:hypothetical protein